MSDEDVWAALAEPNRRAVLAALTTDELTVTAIADAVGLSQPTTSKHLKVLRDAGLVSVRRQGQQRWYAIDPAGLQTIDRWLEPYRRRWTDALARLDAHLGVEDRPEGEG